MKVWAMPCRATQDGCSLWRVLTKRNPLERKMGNHSSIVTMRTPWTVWKGKIIWHQKMSPPNQKVSNMLIKKRGRQLLIAPERIKWLGKAEVMLICLSVWWWKSNLMLQRTVLLQRTEPGMLGSWIKVNQIVKQAIVKHRHLRNQWTKMDGNGWI